MRYPGTEDAFLEFKEKVPRNQQITKTIIGFCNHLGGKVVVGVDDEGTIVGLPESDIPEAVESLQQAIYQSCTPPIMPFVYAQRIEDKVVLVVEVSMGMNKPYFCTREGMESGTYIRVGAHTQKASMELIRELQWQARNHALDELPIYQATVNDLNDDALQHFFEKRMHPLTASQQEELLMHYKLVVEEHKQPYPSVAGMMLFGDAPQDFLSEAFIICTHFKGVLGREVLATRDCTGTLFQQLTDAIAFVHNRLTKKFTINKTKREEQLEIPEIALREVIINALIHRNYQLAGPCKIAIYDDRVEIYSPGAFPGPLQTDQLELGVTYIRNRVIARVFREAKLAEKLGSGFPTLFESYRHSGLPPPTVINGASFVKCVLPRPTAEGVLAPSSDRQDALTRLFNSAAEISVKDIMHYCHVSRAQAGRMLRAEVEKGFLLKVGKGPSTRYRFKMGVKT